MVNPFFSNSIDRFNWLAFFLLWMTGAAAKLNLLNVLVHVFFLLLEMSYCRFLNTFRFFFSLHNFFCSWFDEKKVPWVLVTTFPWQHWNCEKGSSPTPFCFNSCQLIPTWPRHLSTNRHHLLHSSWFTLRLSYDSHRININSSVWQSEPSYGKPMHSTQNFIASQQIYIT